MANELVLKTEPAAVPAIIERSGGNARFAYEEFFKATINNEHTRRVLVNGVAAENRGFDFHEWEARLTNIKTGKLEITAVGEDAAGNVERMPHKLTVIVE